VNDSIPVRPLANKMHDFIPGGLPGNNVSPFAADGPSSSLARYPSNAGNYSEKVLKYTNNKGSTIDIMYVYTYEYRKVKNRRDLICIAYRWNRPPLNFMRHALK
jgi:hypothetical protein